MPYRFQEINILLYRYSFMKFLKQFEKFANSSFPIFNCSLSRLFIKLLKLQDPSEFNCWPIDPAAVISHYGT